MPERAVCSCACHRRTWAIAAWAGAGRALHRDACTACGGVPGSLRPDGGGDGAGAGAAQAYSNSLVDFHMVLDLLPGLAGAFFSRALPANLTWGQVLPAATAAHQNTHRSRCDFAGTTLQPESHDIESRHPILDVDDARIRAGCT